MVAPQLRHRQAPTPGEKKDLGSSQGGFNLATIISLREHELKVQEWVGN